jgi:hypothetical protein
MSSRLRPQQLEARVIDLVDLVLAGGRIEDDLVECKSQWPDPQQRSSTRQLAGHANKAHDEPILWIIGIDEKTHTLTQPSPAQSRSRTGGLRCPAASTRLAQNSSTTSSFMWASAKR